MSWSTGVSTKEQWGRRVEAVKKLEVIRFGTYNIRNRCNVGLESELLRIAWVNVDLGLLQETKITDDVYTQESARFRVVALDTLSCYRGGVSLF